jgi:hypothetical protein
VKQRQFHLPGEDVVEKSPRISAEALGRLLQEKAPELAEKIVAAINAAPDGNWIAGSEEQVRAAGHEFVRAAFEAGLQQKITAAEAAFPPSAGLNRKKKTQ